MKMTYKIQYLLESNWELLISRHFSKGLFQFLGDCFELLLLSNKFILKPVNLLLQLLDRFVSKCCSCFCFFSGFFQLFLQACNSFVIIYSLVFKNFLSAFRVISCSSSLIKLCICSNQLLLSLLKIFFKTLNSSVKSIHLCFSCKKRFLLLFKL